MTITAGSTIIFASGQTWPNGIAVSSSYFNNPSDEAGRITLRASSAATKAVINASGASYGIKITRNYITARDFEIYGVTASGDSYGVYVDGSYNKVLYNYIHDCGTSNLYTIEIQNGSYNEIAYNELKDNRYKQISGTTTTHHYSSIHHNTIHWTSSFYSQIEHGIVTGGDHHQVYSNIIYNESSIVPVGYMIKYDGETGGADCHDGVIYNNIIYKAPMAIATMDCLGPTVIANNTLYLADAAGVCTGSGCIHGICLSTDCGSGSYQNITVRNNIIYYPRISNSYSHMILLNPTTSTSNIVITNNLFDYNGTLEGFRVGSTNGVSAATMAGSYWNGTNGNVFQNNRVANPGFVGGSHIVGQLPTGFNSNGVPNAAGLSLTSNSAAIGAGYAMGAPFTLDINGVARPQVTGWDIGAYVFNGGITGTKIPNTTTILGIGN